MRSVQVRRGLSLFLPITLAACRPAAQPQKPLTPVRVEAVTTVEKTAGIRYSATILPREQVTLSWKAAGYVASIKTLRGSDGRPRRLQPGDLVTKGDVLARLRDDDYRERVAQAGAALAEIEAAAARVRLDLARAETLFAARALTRPDLEAARAQAAATEARVDAARAQARSAGNGLADTALTAPISGVILGRSMEEGSLVNVGSPGFVIADTRTVKAVFGVPDLMVQELSPGQPLTLVVEAAPGEPFQGVVTGLSPSADRASRVFEVEVSIPNEAGRLKTGMIAAVGVTLREDRSRASAGLPSVSLTAVLKSPSSAGDSDAYAVYVAEKKGENAVVHLREVRLGEVFGNRIAVTQGLAAGDEVVVTGATLVRDGETVRVIP